MNVTSRTRTLHLATALGQAAEQLAGTLESDATRGHLLRFDNGTSVRIRATREGAWLVLAAAPGSTDAGADLERLVRWNAELEGVAKFVLAPGKRLAHLRGDIPLDREVDLPSMVATTCAGIRRGHALLAGLPPSAHASGALSERRKSARRGNPESLAECCRRSGWRVSRRGDGGLAVDVDALGKRFRILVEAARDRVRLSSSLGRPVADAAACREATALHLLNICDAVRLARASMRARAGALVADLEVCLAAPPPVALLAGAVRALIVARDLCLREIDALQTPHVARELLRLRRPGAAGASLLTPSSNRGSTLSRDLENGGPNHD